MWTGVVGGGWKRPSADREHVDDGKTWSPAEGVESIVELLDPSQEKRSRNAEPRLNHAGERCMGEIDEIAHHDLRPTRLQRVGDQFKVHLESTDGNHAP